MATRSEELSDSMEQFSSLSKNAALLSEAAQYDSSSGSDSHFGSLPDLPQRLLTRRRKNSNSSVKNKAKVVVVLQSETEASTAGCLSIEPVTGFIKLAKPQPKKDVSESEQRVGISQAPKMFPVDGVFTFPKEKDNLYAAVLGDQIVAILDGFDGNVIYFNNVRQRFSHAESKDTSQSTLGLFPAAVNWLFRIIEDYPSSENVQCHVAVSALELKYSGRMSWDLLANLGNQSLQQSCDLETEPTEIPATNAKEALSYVDVALLEKRRLDHIHMLEEPLYPGSHLFLTLHLYRSQQDKLNENSMGRMKHSRLHILELINPFGQGENTSPATAPTPSAHSQTERHFQHSVFANALMLLTGQMPLNLKENHLLRLLHKYISENVKKASLVIHTFVGLEFYMQNLHLLQFSVKFQNFWRRQANSHSFSVGRRKASNTTDVPGEAENKAAFLDRTQRLGRKGRRFPRRRPIAVQCAARSQGLKDAAPTSHSDIEYTSSSEQSCSTVIYLGRSHPLRRQLETSRRMAINESLERFPPELADHQTKNMEEKSVVPIAGCHSQENIKARRHSADDGTDVAHEDAQPSGTLPPKATTRHREDYKQRQRLKQRQKHLLSSRSIELWVDGPKSQQAVGPSAWTRASRAVKDFQTTRPDTNLWHRTDWQAAETRGALSKCSSEEIKESENQVRCQLELDGQPGAFSLQQSTLKHLRKCKQGYFLAEPRTGRLVPPVVSSDLHQDECSQVNTNAQKNEDRVELPLTLGSPSLSRSQLQRKPEISRREVYQEQQSRVTPFVKEWIENQNNVFSSGPRESSLQPAQPTSDGDTWPQIHTILNPISCLEGQVETIIKSGPAIEVATPLTSIRSRFGRNAASKGARGRDSPMRIVFPINNKYPLTPSRSLPRTNNTEGWIQRSPFTDSSLSRVARWVESVSKETSSGSPGMPTAKSPKARHQPRHLPPSCGAPIGAPASAALPLNSDVKVLQTNAGSRIGSAPAVHSHHALHCLAHFKPVEDTIPVLQCLSGSGVAAGAAKYDLHKPGGASDPGFSQDLHLYSREKEPKQQQQQQPANNVGCPMELPKQKAVSKRQNRTHKRLQKFADFFVCSPHAPARQNTAMLTGPGTRPSTARVRKMCAPFFWPSRERERSDDVLSVDSVGMLFTTSVKRKDDRNLSCAPQPRTPHCEATIELVETPTKPVLKPKHRYKPGDLPLLKKSDDSDGHWLGFVPTSRFTDCAGQSGLGLSTKLKNCVSLGHDMAPVGMRTTTTPGDPVPTKYNATAVHSAGEHFIVPTTNTNTVNANSPKIAPNPIRQWPIKVFSSTSAKCVSQSSSSGLGSEHSCADSAIRTDVVNEPAKASTDTSMPTVRCYCKQSTGRSPRCKACGHYSQIHRHIEVSDAYLELVKGTPQLGVSKTLPYLADASLPLNAGSTGPSPVIESREPSSYVGGGGHASSGYDSILRDSEVSSHSETTSESSVGHMRFAGEACQCGALMLSTLHQQLPLMGRNSKDDAACQTSPFPLENHVWDGKGTCEVKSMQPTLDGSLTLTESFSEATASVAMDSSTTSKNSNPRPLSPSTSKRSISVPGQSEHTSEDSTSSLPSVRRVSPILNRVQCSLESVRLSESQALQTFTTEASCITASEDDANEVRKRKIISLLSRQEALKAELTAAKSRLLADPGSWGFDLNVTQRMDLDDECFVEALENETELLQQRVNACNFHVKYVSYFQPPSLGSDP